MFSRPLDLSQNRETELRAYVEDIEVRLVEIVETLLQDVPLEPIRDQIRAIAFTPNDALYKRSIRPNRSIFHLVDQLSLAYSVDEAERSLLLQLSVNVAEYYDIFDDLVDGDVKPEARGEVLATWQAMYPLTLQRVHALGDDVVSYWSAHAIELMEAPLAGLRSEPSIEAYEAITDRQSHLFGFLTALPAIVANKPNDVVEHAAAIGRTFFKYDQYLLDMKQTAESDLAWNVGNLTSEPAVRDRLESFQAELETHLAHLPEERARMIRPLLAVDIDAYLNGSCEEGG